MNEPTANLDYDNQMRLLEHTRVLAVRGLAFVLSTQVPATPCRSPIALRC
ncbi:hypothetical protein [Rhizobium leguminosarum]|nr:hypothetical protein [Rhizobium leguminosarum]